MLNKIKEGYYSEYNTVENIPRKYNKLSCVALVSYLLLLTSNNSL